MSSAAPKKKAFDRGGQTGPPQSNAFRFGAADDTGKDNSYKVGVRFSESRC